MMVDGVPAVEIYISRFVGKLVFYEAKTSVLEREGIE